LRHTLVRTSEPIGHWQIYIVDRLEQWHFETGAYGGFTLLRGLSAPGNLQELVDHVVPELQRRGLSKKEYSGPTLRDNLLH
jgi:hypothetical protein